MHSSESNPPADAVWQLAHHQKAVGRRRQTIGNNVELRPLIYFTTITHNPLVRCVDAMAEGYVVAISKVVCNLPLLI
jgi:hypothetical protein